MLHTIEERIAAGKYVLIAEAGVNYYDIAKEKNLSTIDAAKLMIKEAADSKVHAIKFQSYKANTLASKDSPYYWDIAEEPTTSQFELFKKFDSFGEAEYAELAEYAEQCKIEFLSTAFDIQSADYLEKFMNVYKISSSDLNNLPFVKYQAKKNKPILLSIGAADFDEIKRTVEVIRSVNDKTLTLLHCVLEYPTPYEHANLNKIKTLAENFPNMTIGYSDHTKPDEGYEVLKTAYNLGAQVIEKHFTLDKNLKGNDHYHAMDPDDIRKIIEKFDYIDMLRGKGELKCLETEMKARENARRSLVAAKNLAEGEIITPDMITWKRPASGIPVDEFDSIVGKKVSQNITEDTVLQYSMFS